MTAPRYNIYQRIHKALRTCVADTMLRLGRVDSNDDAEFAAVLDQVRNMCTFMTSHLFHEDVKIHPLMESLQSGSTRQTVQEHEHHDYACRKLISLASVAEQAPLDERAALAEMLYQQTALFLAETLTHMHMEETENNAVLWATHSDEQLLALEQSIVASLTPEEKAISMRWMMPSLTPRERAMMLQGARRAAPPPVFAAMLEQVKGVLSASDWAKLATALEL